jgi:hypothetical protein
MIAHISAVNIGAAYIAHNARDTLRRRTQRLPGANPAQPHRLSPEEDAPFIAVVEYT